MHEPQSRTPNDDDERRAAGDGHGQFHPEIRVEQSDVQFWGVVGTLAAFAVSFVLVGAVAWWILRSTESGPRPTGGTASYNRPRQPLPKGPRLEPLNVSEKGELSPNVFERQLAMERDLHSYGPSPEPGFVHIPIEQAIRIAAKKLPVSGQSQGDNVKIYGLLGGGEPNSGRLYMGAPTWFEPKQ